MLLTVKEVSETLHLSVHTIRKWIQLKKIKFVKIGKSIRIHKDEVDRLMKGE